MTEFSDALLGVIIIRRHPKARGVSFKVSPKGVLTASAPRRLSLATIKRSVKSARPELQAMLDEHRQRTLYQSGQEIGKSHRLEIVHVTGLNKITIDCRDRIITLRLPEHDSPANPEAQAVIQSEVIKALKREADTYLKRRLLRLAQRHGYSFTKVRLTHTGTRWGSCSTTGTISLNIALMKLPLELIDYVLIHELCHTQQMNHSPAFWKLVGLAEPHYQSRRRQLRTHTPAL